MLAKFGFDTAENEPCKDCPLSAYRSPRCPAYEALVKKQLGPDQPEAARAEHVDPVEKAKRAGLEELERAKEAGEKAEEDDLAWEKLNLMNASATQAQKDLSSPPPAAPVALPGQSN